MTGEEKLTINIKIAGKEFSLQTLQKNEGKIRATAKLITETFDKYKDKFPTNDYANILAMTSLTLLIDDKLQQNSEENLEIKGELYELEEQMENFLESEE